MVKKNVTSPENNQNEVTPTPAPSAIMLARRVVSRLREITMENTQGGNNTPASPQQRNQNNQGRQ